MNKKATRNAMQDECDVNQKERNSKGNEKPFKHSRTPNQLFFRENQSVHQFSWDFTTHSSTSNASPKLSVSFKMNCVNLS
jgi:hypothetical protein